MNLYTFRIEYPGETVEDSVEAETEAQAFAEIEKLYPGFNLKLVHIKTNE